LLREEVGTFFDFDRDSPYMLQGGAGAAGRGRADPAAVHVNGTTRLQTVRREEEPLYHALIAAFRDLTGIPMVINTSFNDRQTSHRLHARPRGGLLPPLRDGRARSRHLRGEGKAGP